MTYWMSHQISFFIKYLFTWWGTQFRSYTGPPKVFKTREIVAPFWLSQVDWYATNVRSASQKIRFSWVESIDSEYQSSIIDSKLWDCYRSDLLWVLDRIIPFIIVAYCKPYERVSIRIIIYNLKSEWFSQCSLWWSDKGYASWSEHMWWRQWLCLHMYSIREPR